MEERRFVGSRGMVNLDDQLLDGVSADEASRVHESELLDFGVAAEMVDDRGDLGGGRRGGARRERCVGEVPLAFDGEDADVRVRIEERLDDVGGLLLVIELLE